MTWEPIFNEIGKRAKPEVIESRSLFSETKHGKMLFNLTMHVEVKQLDDEASVILMKMIHSGELDSELKNIIQSKIDNHGKV